MMNACGALRMILLPLLLFMTIALAGCENKQSEQAVTPERKKTAIETAVLTAPPIPPAPPVFETFDDKPKLSLFPRIGGTRPADDDKEKLSYWKTFIDHTRRTAGVVQKAGVDNSNCWGFRGNDGVISLGYFSPLAVQPASTYRVSFDFMGEMPEKGEAGIGILEFKEFLWLADQYTEKQLQENLVQSQTGVRLAGKQKWASHSFDFTTTPNTGMIHLVMFREGEQDREAVFFDNIRIEALNLTSLATEK